MSKLKASLFGVIIAIIFAVGGVLLGGGSTGPKQVKVKNCTYVYEYDQNESIIAFISDCKLAHIGDKCNIRVGASVTKLHCDTVEETLAPKKEEVKEVPIVEPIDKAKLDTSIIEKGTVTLQDKATPEVKEAVETPEPNSRDSPAENESSKNVNR